MWGVVSPSLAALIAEDLLPRGFFSAIVPDADLARAIGDLFRRAVFLSCKSARTHPGGLCELDEYRIEAIAQVRGDPEEWSDSLVCALGQWPLSQEERGI